LLVGIAFPGLKQFDAMVSVASLPAWLRWPGLVLLVAGLALRFGQSYRDYQARTPFLVPRIFAN
jgi:protein-S-isoprenylcysteine O-methyltransferase Ste14